MAPTPIAHGDATGRPTGERPTGSGPAMTSATTCCASLATSERQELPSGRTTLDRFVDELSAFALGRVVDQAGQEARTWRLLAEVITAATVCRRRGPQSFGTPCG